MKCSHSCFYVILNFFDIDSKKYNGLRVNLILTLSIPKLFDGIILRRKRLNVRKILSRDKRTK